MGLPGLWKVLEPVTHKKSLKDIAASHIYSNDQLLAIGVDASSWCYKCQYATQGRGRGWCARENPALLMVFHKMLKLSSLPVSVVFVQDGPERLPVKRGIQVRLTPHSLINGMKNFAQALGFQWVHAPGEAEAELGQMSRNGRIDAVMTEDSDAFRLGAKVVFRKGGVLDDSLVVREVTYSDLVDGLPGTQSLTIENLLLLAVLKGGDYDKGLPGCGLDTALSLSSSIANHGEALSTLAWTYQHNIPRLEKELSAWREDVASELATNCNRALKRKMPDLARKLRSMRNFPDPVTLLEYAIPVTSDDGSLLGRPSRGRLDITHLAQTCELYFPFGASWTSLLEKLVRAASASFIMDSLIGNFRDNRTSYAIVEPTILKRRDAESDLGFAEFRCALPSADAASILATSLRGLRDPLHRKHSPHLSGWPAKSTKQKSKKKGIKTRAVKERDLSKFIAWIPSTVLYQVMPNTVEAFMTGGEYIANRGDARVASPANSEIVIDLTEDDKRNGGKENTAGGSGLFQLAPDGEEIEELYMKDRYGVFHFPDN
ncbi:PIN domain-like protein [Schizopora paradoxa]|uniref:PIN domain-like protein n=1 Tax=Schizopora paradoxa TaxID=27342 RepID=A0A0H2RMH4_9AGAM|nr:PIN domain-like protein [Schizopora paradoxa]